MSCCLKDSSSSHCSNLFPPAIDGQSVHRFLVFRACPLGCEAKHDLLVDTVPLQFVGHLLQHLPLGGGTLGAWHVCLAKIP